jgi:cytochrome c oxidase subunit 2
MKPSKLLVVAACLLVVALVAGAAGVQALAGQAGQVIKVTAKRYEYNPSVITLKKGVPVTLEFTSLDLPHGFNCPDLKIRTDIMPGKVNRVHFVPQKTGTFACHCDIFCGEGHEDMAGKIVVTE